MYLLKFLRYYLENETNVLILNSHKVLSITFDKLELRCSYLLLGTSLGKACEDYKPRHSKLSGTIDYNVVRFQDTKLTFRDEKYMINDVISLHEIIKILIKEKRGKISELPLTKTGYVRQFCRQKAKEDVSNRRMFNDTRLTLEQFKRFNIAFKGGYCHSNIKTRSHLIEGNIEHYDYRSHYPSVMMLEKYPVSAFKSVDFKRKDLDKNYEYCSFLLTIYVYNCKLKQDKRFTYISISDIGYSKAINDNGRVYECNEPFYLFITYEDLLIIEDVYDINYDIVEVEYAIKDYLPAFMRDSIKEFMYNKTKFKILEKEADNDIDRFNYSIDLMKNKGMLNAIYGMCATSPLRQEYELDSFGSFNKIGKNLDEEKEALDKFYKSRNSFLPYQWSLWVTSYARKYLFDIFNLLGHENVLYCDTDSAFVIKQDNTDDLIKSYNEELYKKAIETDSYIKYNNKIVNFGAFEDEGEDITRFKALHSKCYMFECNNKLHSVIAGVVSAYKDSTGVHYNTEECNTFDKFDDSFIFSKRFGGSTCKYNQHSICTEDIEGHLTEYSDSAIIYAIEKELHNNYDEI